MPVGTSGELLAGRYRVERRLGAGGMATVFLAHDERLDRKVAIKRLHADSPDDEGLRFRREAKVGASLNNPNVVSVYDTVRDDEGLLIVMEYVEGHTLRDEMARGRMAPGRALELLAGIAAALDHAHEHGVVHRDVKPANILIAERGDMVKLADLGIATASERTSITQSGTVLGTAAYMAPERLEGHAGGPAVDIYALAAVAYEALSGRKAFSGATAMEIARRIATQPPPALTDVVADAPPRASEVLRRGLAKDPAERPASARELVLALSDAYAEQRRSRPTAPVAVPPPRREPPAPTTAPSAAIPPPPGRSRRAGRGPLAASLVALAAIAAIVAALALGGNGGNGGGRSAADQTAGKGAGRSSKSHGATSSGTPGASSQTGQAGQTGQAAPATPSAPAATPSGSAGAGAATPQEAISGFYQRPISGDFQGAWALASPNAQGEVGGFDGWKKGEQDLKSIQFPKLQVISQSGNRATVAFESVAQHSSHTDHCNGTMDTVKQGAGWLVDFLHVNCSH